MNQRSALRDANYPGPIAHLQLILRGSATTRRPRAAITPAEWSRQRKRPILVVSLEARNNGGRRPAGLRRVATAVPALSNELGGVSWNSLASCLRPWVRLATSEHPERLAADEAALVGRAQAGDREAFAALVERYYDRVYRWLYRLTHHQHQAEDLTQETFLKAFRALAMFRKGSNFSAWVYRIAYNGFLN